MTAISEKYAGQGLVVLAVNAWDEPKEDVAKFLKDNNLRHKVLLNGGSLRPTFGVGSIPTTFWIDKGGIIRDTEIGFAGPEDLAARTESLLSAK